MSSSMVILLNNIQIFREKLKKGFSSVKDSSQTNGQILIEFMG